MSLPVFPSIKKHKNKNHTMLGSPKTKNNRNIRNKSDENKWKQYRKSRSKRIHETPTTILK
jgi:hypothetical protein